jgi:hypothetical protein
LFSSTVLVLHFQELGSTIKGTLEHLLHEQEDVESLPAKKGVFTSLNRLFKAFKNEREVMVKQRSAVHCISIIVFVFVFAVVGEETHPVSATL